MVDQIVNYLLENDAEDFGDEDLRDIWADTTDIERFPRGMPVEINREHSSIHGLKGTVIKSRFDKAIIRLNPGEWERGQLVGQPEDFILPLEEIVPLSEGEEDFEEEDFKDVYVDDPWTFQVNPERIHWKPWKLVIYHFGKSVGSDYFYDREKAARYGEEVVAAAYRVDKVDPYKSEPHVWAWLDRHRAAPKVQEAEEDFDDEEFDASQAQDVRDVDAHTLDDIKAAEPGFFSRTNNKFFGTKKIYQYGHFLVLKNRKKSIGHFGNVDYRTSYSIYEFIKTDQNPQGILLHRGSAGNLRDAKEMIKLKDYRSKYERAREMVAKMRNPVAESADDDEDDFDAEQAKEIGTMSDLSAWREHDVLKATEKFALVRFQNGKTGLVCRVPNHRPDRVRVQNKDVDYLLGLGNDSFNSAAVFDFGCGVWKIHGSDEEAEQIEKELDGG